MTSNGPNAGISVRPAWPGEADLVLQFIKDLAEYETLCHEVSATEDSIDLALFSAMPKAFCEIAEFEGIPAGFALWFYSFSTFRGKHGIYLEDLFVRPDYRGKGLGKAMLGKLAQRCIQEGLARLEWSVLDWNTPSIEFYKSLDAQPMDEWTVFRVTDEPLTRLAEAAP